MVHCSRWQWCLAHTAAHAVPSACSARRQYPTVACPMQQEQIRVLTQRKMELAATEEAAKASPEEQKQVCQRVTHRQKHFLPRAVSTPKLIHLALGRRTCLSAQVACCLVCASDWSLDVQQLDYTCCTRHSTGTHPCSSANTIRPFLQFASSKHSCHHSTVANPFPPVV